MDALDNGKCNVSDNAFNLPPLLYSAEEDSDVKIFKTISLGIEGSANKIGVGIIRCTCTRTRILSAHDQINSEYEYKYFYEILCNPRKTYITPAGQGIPEVSSAFYIIIIKFSYRISSERNCVAPSKSCSRSSSFGS